MNSSSDFYRKGRGAQQNTANQFLKHQYEPDTENAESEGDVRPNPKTQFFTETPKKILSALQSPDMPSGFSLNPYQGCEHGCIYCYARNTHEYWGFSAGMDFESKIMVKHTAPQLLEAEFRSPKWKPVPIEISGNTDCYQPAERKFGLTRRLLELFVKYRNPVGLITKNSVILRDLDLLTQLAELNLVHVYISLTTLNEELRLALEPRTVTARQRLNVIEKLSAAGIPVGVMTAPIIPGLNDHEIPALVEAAAQAGARTAGYTVVRLNGAIGELFTDWIHKAFPDRAHKVLAQIRDCHGGQLNDSRWGTRMTGEGPLAQHIAQLHQLARRRFMAGREMPKYDLTQFRRDGLQMKLF